MSGAIHNRRRFLEVCTDAVVALIGACMAVPALAYVLAPIRRWTGKKGGGGDFQDVGAVTQLPIESMAIGLVAIRAARWVGGSTSSTRCMGSPVQRS